MIHYISLELVFFNSLLALGVNAFFWPGNAGSSIALKYLSHLPTRLRKPLYECLPCMSSIWGAFFYVTYFFSDIHDKKTTAICFLLLHVFAVFGLNVILDSAVHYWRRGGNMNLKPQKKTYL